MRHTWILPLLAAASFAGCSTPQPAQEPDRLLKATTKYLAKSWNMTPVVNGDSQTGKVGALHGVREIQSEKALFANQAPVTLEIESDTTVKSTVVREQSYVFGDTLSQSIADDLKADLVKEGVSTEGFIRAMRSMNITFTVEKHQAFGQDIRNAITSGGYANSKIPAGYGGLIVPQQSLVIKDLKFSDHNDSSAEGKLAGNYLRAFAANFSGSRSDDQIGTATENMPVHIAITPVPVRFTQP
jgi:hypothetical protein